MQRDYPGCIQFNSDNFGRCPLPIIRQALHHASILKLEEAERINLGFSIYAIDWLASISKKGDRLPDFSRYNPSSKILQQIEARKQFSVDTANIFMKLVKENRIPDWVVKALDDRIDVIHKAAD